jgi:hypothetical protein
VIASLSGGPPIIECEGAVGGIWIGCEVMRLFGPSLGYTVMQAVVSVLVATMLVGLSWHAERSKRSQ